MAPMRLPKNLAKKVLAENLKECLKERGLQQNDFAKSIGMSPQQFSFYIRGKREPDEVNLGRMADKLGLASKWELLRMSDNMAEKPITEAWNALIDLHNLSTEDVIKARDYIKLLIASHQTQIPEQPKK